MQVIKLTKGQKTIVDNDDYPLLNQWRWCADLAKNYNPSQFRAVRTISYRTSDGIRRYAAMYMSRFIMNPSPYEEVDHINGNCLDNRKENLRICTNQQNKQNNYKQLGVSIYKGVCREKKSRINPWRSQINFDGKRIHLGCFDNEETAARMYDFWAQDLFGEFANTNFAGDSA